MRGRLPLPEWVTDLDLAEMWGVPPWTIDPGGYSLKDWSDRGASDEWAERAAIWSRAKAKRQAQPARGPHRS